MKPSLAYISDLSARPDGGGSYTVNFKIHQQLQHHFELFTPPPVTPRLTWGDQFVSRLQRYVLRRPSDFAYFSAAMLDRNARKVSAALTVPVDALFFRSATRWCHYTPRSPYFVYLDAVFHTFFDNTFAWNKFRQSDLERIFKAEAHFLEQASAVFFESAWGLDKARQAYDLQHKHYHVAGRGGGLELPHSDQWKGGLNVLTIAKNFAQKGGDIVLEAFRILKPRYPQLCWHVIGGPPEGIKAPLPGMVCHGMLNTGNPGDLARYRDLLSQAFLLLHPTREDTSPLVITEAASFGCPAIAVKQFAIPELVVEGGTGILLDSPVQAIELAEAVAGLIESRDVYRAMRHQAFAHAKKSSDWNSIGSFMAQIINSALT